MSDAAKIVEKAGGFIKEVVTSDAAKIVATAVVTTAVLVGTHLAIKKIEGEDES